MAWRYAFFAASRSRGETDSSLARAETAAAKTTIAARNASTHFINFPFRSRHSFARLFSTFLSRPLLRSCSKKGGSRKAQSRKRGCKRGGLRRKRDRFPQSTCRINLLRLDLRGLVWHLSALSLPAS